MNEQHKAHVYAWENWKTSQHQLFAHKQAREYADKYSDPIIQPQRYAYFYWQVMSNYGWRPYHPLMGSAW